MNQITLDTSIYILLLPIERNTPNRIVVSLSVELVLEDVIQDWIILLIYLYSNTNDAFVRIVDDLFYNNTLHTNYIAK